MTYLKYSVHYGPLLFLFSFVFFQQGTVFLCHKKLIETELCYSAVLPSFLPFLSLWAACSPQALDLHPIWRTSCQVHHSEPKERVSYCPNWGSNIWTVDPKSSVLTTLPSQYQLRVLLTQSTYHLFFVPVTDRKKKSLCILQSCTWCGHHQTIIINVQFKSV